MKLFEFMSIDELLTFFLIGVGLSFDSFAVSVSYGLMRQDLRFTQAVPVASVLAFSQTLLPVTGWFAGNTLHSLIHSVDHWIAFILLASIGIKMILEGRKGNGSLNGLDPYKFKVVLGLAIATSIDSLVVGFSFGFLETPIVFPAIIIGVVTFFASMLGMLFGKNIPAKRSRQSLILGGIILTGMGIKILIEHLWF
ncbi:MAG: manganese efflux pump MntP family protein [Mariniphaga sp.]|nr:manganese efflux pump MntP family protein [Mariniphaga sp.]MDD4108207.1 manganese efflux pump MntP family protein [Prolixibacteraceae bacterium]